MSKKQAADPATVAEICAQQGVPQHASWLIREGATLDEVRKKSALVGGWHQAANVVAAEVMEETDYG